MAIIQKSIDQKTTLTKKILGMHPIIQFFIERLNIPGMIGNHILQDTRSSLLIEKTLSVLIHNILTASMPMYEIADWSKTICEESIGTDEGENELICDDRIGRALDRFYSGKHKEVFFQTALRAIKIFNLDCSRIHQDTTSITLSGKYRDWNAYELATFGKNKDRRPDLKQLVLGLSITADGAVPLAHQVYNGNQTDDTLHIENHKKIRKLLQRSDFIYVADSKLATENNLEKISSYGGKFISIMPRSWREDKDFKTMIENEKISWRHLLTKKSKPDTGENEKHKYYIACGDYTAKSYRLLWIKSDQKKILDQESRTHRIEKTMKALHSLNVKLGKRNLKTKAVIKNKVNKILEEYQCQDIIKYTLHSKKEFKKKYQLRGRPRQNQNAKSECTTSFVFNFFVNQEEVNKRSLSDGIFPIITNIKKEDKGAKEILEIYKYQPFLEKRHSQLKTWQRITPVLLKNGKRVVAYIHMHVFALMVSTLIERTIRTGMKRLKIESLPIYPERKQCFSPTFYDLERIFRNVEKYEIKRKDNVQFFPANLSSLQKKILNLLDVPLSLYQ